MLVAAVKSGLLDVALLGQQLPRSEHELPVCHLPALLLGEDGLDGVAERAVGRALRRGQVRRGLVGLAPADQHAVPWPPWHPHGPGEHLIHALEQLLFHGWAERVGLISFFVALRLSVDAVGYQPCASGGCAMPKHAAGHGLDELLDLGRGVVPEVVEQRGPDRSHGDVVLAGLLPEHPDERRQGQRPARGRGRGAAREADADVLERGPDSVDERGAKLAGGGGRRAVLLGLLALLGAAPDLLLGLVDEAAAVARVGHHGEEAAVGDFLHQLREILVFDEVDVGWHDALVVASVVVEAGLGGQLQAMAAVVEEEGVPGPRAGDELLELQPDVGARGRRRGRVGVGEDTDVGLVETEAVHEAEAHAGHVVEAALELPLRARVVDAHQHRALPAHRCSSLPERLAASDALWRRPATAPTAGGRGWGCWGGELCGLAL